MLGHPYGPNEERGVYRTTNGGKNWDKVKYIDENTGAMQVAIDPNNPKVVYADFWANRLAPWENGEWRGPNSGLWKSIDGGNTWKQLTKGLPGAAQNLGRIGFCICPSMSSRLYATVDCGGGGEPVGGEGRRGVAAGACIVGAPRGGDRQRQGGERKPDGDEQLTGQCGSDRRGWSGRSR